MLYFVATPIGNLEDLSPRARRILSEVHAIAAEDTRRTRKLLSRFDIHTPLFSFHRHNERQRTGQIIARLRNGESLAVVSDSGMPLISDAGHILVQRLQEEGIEYTCVPGPSAVETALVVSGLPTDAYQFLGFVPREKKERRKFWRAALNAPITTVVYESPKRLLKAVDDIEALAPGRELVVVRELTKIHEEVVRGTPDEITAHFQRAGECSSAFNAESKCSSALNAETEKVNNPHLTPMTPKGECVLLIAPTQAEDQSSAQVDVAELMSIVQDIAGVSHSTAAKIVAALTGQPRRAIYRQTLKKGKRE